MGGQALIASTNPAGAAQRRPLRFVPKGPLRRAFRASGAVVFLAAVAMTAGCASGGDPENVLVPVAVPDT